MKNSIIGLMMSDTPQLPVGILGILTSGNAFVPIHPANPAERIHYIIRDCRIRLLVTDRRSRDIARRVLEDNSLLDHLLCLDPRQPHYIERISRARPPAAPARPEAQETSSAGQNCYFIYTSGSTGRPKGVGINHGNLVPLLSWFRHYFGLGGHTRVLLSLSYAFDFGIFEILTTLLWGGTLYIPDPTEQGGPAAYADFLERYRVNTVHTTPGFFSQIVSLGRPLPGVEIVHLGGEPLSGRLVGEIARIVAPDCRIYNGYGPTEATINTSIYCVEAGEAVIRRDGDSVPIGRPTARHRVYILDKHLREQPPGVPGELCIAGEGLSAGYLNNPRLTADKFVVSPDLPVLYRTGDRARFLPGGDLEFLGRIDQQVKIRGFRIEPGEIENRLLRHEQVEAVAVVARGDDHRGRYLTAYIVASPAAGTGGPGPGRWREFLAGTLPDYMIPAYFVEMDVLPLTPGGKVDRRALPVPQEGDLVRSTGYTPPRSEAERSMAALWQEILDVSRVGIHDDFFELGGDSILANRVIARMKETSGMDISLRRFLENPSISALCREMPRQGEATVHIPRAPRRGRIPLSFSQERLWFLQQLDGDSTAYHVPRALRIRGKVEITLFEKTFTEIIRRHEILRTVFPAVKGEPVQQVRPPFFFTIPVLDWRRLPEEEREAKVEEFVAAEGCRSFDFRQGPLIRMTLLRLRDNESVLVSSEHHLVHDGWTQGVMLQEFSRIYRAFAGGKPSPLPELPIQYADYATWQRQYMSGERLQRHLDFWKRELADLAPLLELPADYDRPPVISGAGRMDRVILRQRSAEQLERFSRRHGVTMFMTMLGVFKVLLYRYTGIEDLCVGTGIANRRSREMEGMLGMVINTLVLRTRIAGDMDFSRCLARVKTACLRAYEYEDTPFEKVVEALRPERNLSYTPLVQVMFSFMDTPTGSLSLPGLEFDVETSHNRSAKFDLNVVVIPPHPGEELAGEILIDWEYNTDLFNPETMGRLQAHYRCLLEETLKTPYRQIAALPMLADAELKRVLYYFNDTCQPFFTDRRIEEGFGQLAGQFPGQRALVSPDGEQVLSYGELYEQARRLAVILKNRGLARAEIVGVRLPRSPAWAIALWGILQAGGIYLPLDPAYPRERLDYMMQESGAGWILSGEETDRLDSENIVRLTATGVGQAVPSNPEPGPGSSPAYIIYTSGTTGRPKGVLIRHASLVNLCCWHHRCFGITAADNTSQYAQISFDASIWEFFGNLTRGAGLHIIADELKLDILRLNRYFEIHHITVAFLPTQMAEHFMAYENLSLRILLTGGDKLKRFEGRRYAFYNNYGPTECTVAATSGLIEGERSNIPIGRPIDNYRAYILDGDHLQVQPPGAAGELFFGGSGLALGYLNNPELTAARFISPESRILYRTGDRARFRTDGAIEFLGRVDQQVKIRGFRIEPPEIETRLGQHPRVKEAVVVDRERGDGEKYLCAYIVSVDREENSVGVIMDELRRHLCRCLPEYMVPAHFVRLERIPLTSGGKVDRRALPEPEFETAGNSGIPETDMEKKLVKIWSDILGITAAHIGVHSHFFRLGGHSLKAGLLAARIHQQLEVRLPLTEIFKNPTLEAMAEYIDNGAGEGRYTSIPNVEEREYYDLSHSQRRIWLMSQSEAGSLAFNIPGGGMIEGDLDPPLLGRVLAALLRRHQSLRTLFIVNNGEPKQRIRPASAETFAVEGLDWRERPDPETGIRELILAELNTPFSLEEGPLLRTRLIRLEEKKYLFLFTLHHIICDGLSMKVILREMAGLYEALGKGAKDPLPPLRIHYRDFTAWQNVLLSGAEIRQHRQYWLRQLQAPLPRLELPLDRPRSGAFSYEGDAVRLEPERAVTRRLDRLCRGRDVTLFMMILALLNVWLYRFSRQTDIIIGVPVAGREHAELENQVGFYLNTLALRTRFSRDDDFTVLLQRVKGVTVAAFQHQIYPFDRLVEELAIPRQPDRHPLFDLLVDMVDISVPRKELENTELSVVPYHHGLRKSKFDLTVYVFQGRETLAIDFDFNTRLFDRDTVEYMAGCFETLMERVTAEPSVGLNELVMEGESDSLLEQPIIAP